ncbi:MAG: FAD-dependent oxidoreductase [Bacteroidales bacterium]|nr:FAD-dependent oxidoreductase [Bacteroidales bacterium]MCF8456473.1 FAD-dependent oxidoreductase [Bacteroidales bacterium]
MANSYSTAKSDLQLVPFEISRKHQLAEDVYLISVPRKSDFEAGQVVAVSLSDGQTPRLYSIASGNAGPEISILFNIKKDGFLSPQLANSKEGDRILVSAPFGNFTCRDEKACWIASGTGIAPFASMFFSGQWKGKTLIHGGRTVDSFYFQDDIAPVMKESYIRCCSQENGLGLYQGRLTSYLKEQTYLDLSQKYYLCGSPEMVVDVRDILISKKVPFENIISEIYF